MHAAARRACHPCGVSTLQWATCMKNFELKTARMQTVASRRGTAVWRLPSRTASGTLSVRAIQAWMFFTLTAASSTRMPMARAWPPSVMTLIVSPVSQSARIETHRASGMLSTTTIALHQSCRKTSTTMPTRNAPRTPSSTTDFTAPIM